MTQGGPVNPSLPINPRSGQLPESARGLCWGGFFLNWIWAIFNGTWIGLLTFVPVIGIVMPFVLLFKGREWAWKNKDWKSVEEFNRIQRTWSIVGLVLGVIGLILLPIILGIFLAIAIPNFQRFQTKARQSEARISLSAVYACERAYSSEFNTFSSDFAKMYCEPISNGRYQVGFADSGSEFAKACPDCVVTAKTFKAVAILREDGKSKPDVWTIDQDKKLVNEVDGSR